MSVHFRGRREDGRLVTGQGKYTSDWSLPNQAYGVFLRADRGHAIIKSIDTSAARSMPGVLDIVTGADTRDAGIGSIPSIVKFPGKDGMMLRSPRRQVLAEDRVRYVGQEVALIVAQTHAQAQDAAEAIVIDYEDLTPVVDATQALAPHAPQLYDDISGNLVYSYEYGSKDRTDDAFAKAHHITRLELDAPRMVGNPMEPKACLAHYDSTKDVYDLYVPSQGLNMMRNAFCAATSIPPEKVRIHAHDVGGGFGIRGEAYSEYCTLALAAKRLGRPVKWVSTRSETFVSDHHGRAAKLCGELALDAKGSFLAIRFHWTVNCGAYLSAPGPFINTLPPSLHGVNVYTIPTLYGLHDLALTNTTPTTAYRGAARPNVSYLVERLVDEAAREMGMDRITLRRINLIPKDAYPYKTPVGSEYDSGDLAGLLDMALQKSDYAGFETRRVAAQKRGKLRGISCCLFVEPAGGGASPVEETAIKFGDSGNPILYTVSGPSGQGHETVYPQIVAEILGIDEMDITLRASDPDGPLLRGDGTIGSRSMMSHGGSLVTSAREVVRRGREMAAKHLEVAETDIEFTRGVYHVAGTDLKISLQELGRLSAQDPARPLDAQEAIPAPRSFPTGCHIAEVEIDPETGLTDIMRYTAVDDCGNIINHTLAEGQVHGGIVQGLGQIFHEAAIYDRASGQLLTGSFMDYTMPRASDLCHMDLYDRPIPAPNNPLGAKGVGEAGTTGSVPTLANAVIDALRPLGIHHVDLPYSPARLWHAIHGQS
jgi:aerobic carbon-monoxide dehydrogenase large subunit